MATKEDLAKHAMTTKEDRKTCDGHQGSAKHAVATKEDFAKHAMATKEDFARIEKKLAVLNFAMFTMGPVLVAFMVKLTFFP